MKNSRLIQILEKFTKKELRDLQQFIQCKLFHINKKQQQKVIELFQILIASKFKSPKLEKEAIYKKLFKTDKIDIKKLNHYIRWAIDLVEKYLVHKYLSDNPMEYELILLESLKKRNLENPFLLLKNKMEKKLATEKEKGSTYFYNQYKIADLSLWLNNIRDKDTAYINGDFESAISSLDFFYLVNQFDFACHTLNISQIVNAKRFDSPLFLKVIEILLQTDYGESPLIQIYWNAYQMLTTNEEPYYQTLKLLLFKNYSILPEYHHFNLFQYIQNYCITKINKGNPHYYSDIWEISIFRLDKKLITSLNFASYKNLITTGVMLALKQEASNFTDVLQFIQQHTNKLPLEYRKEAENYGQSYISFYQGNFQAVPKKLVTSQEPLTIYKFQDIYYQIDARRLLVMTYFCIEGEYINFNKLCDNLSVFLDERKEFIPKLEVTKNRQFLIAVKKISKVYGSKKEKQNQLQQIKQEIEDCQQISDKKWLLKQIKLILSQI